MCNDIGELQEFGRVDVVQNVFSGFVGMETRCGRSGELYVKFSSVDTLFTRNRFFKICMGVVFLHRE